MEHAFERAEQAAGSAARLAEGLGVSLQVLGNWKRRGPPAEKCPALERAVHGAVVCEDLRPDIAWRRVADPEWPWHPAGKPLIDPLPEPMAEAEGEGAAC